MDYRDDLLNLRIPYKIKLPHLTGGGADQAVTAGKQKNKTLLTSKSPAKTMTELHLKC
jgi:hypothetical protein